MSGLSLPLPATVERIAASLVPWADGVAMSANEALRTGARGSIVAALDERPEDGRARLAGGVKTVGTRAKGEGPSVIQLPGAVAPSLPGTTPKVPGVLVPTVPDQGAGPAEPGVGGSAPTTPGPTPTTTREPTQPPAESDPDPVAAVEPVVDEVLAPVAPVVEETTKTVVETIAPVVPVLPGLGK